MTVAVLCTVYNASEYLGAAIDSVLSQTYEDWELLVMEDNSPDKRVHEILESVSDQRVRVHYFGTTEAERRASVRYATLMNWGAAHTSGEYLTYLAGDDAYLPDRLERMVAKLEQGHDVVYGAQRLFNEDGTQFGVRSTIGILTDAWERVDLNSVMHTRESFNIAGGWPTDTAYWRNADAWFWRRLTNAGYLFYPVEGGATDVKRFRADSVDQRVITGKDPW